MKKFLKKLSGLDRKKKIVTREEEELQDEEEQDEEEAEESDETEEENEMEIDEEIAEEIAEELEEEEEEEQAIEKSEEKSWLAEDFEEGQLSIDVYQTPDKLVVKSTIAGVKPEDIDISINNDMLTIRGKRHMEEKIRDENYLFRECYWGFFSRSIILPVEVEPENIEAFLENGVLTVELPKAKSAKQITIKVREK